MYKIVKNTPSFTYAEIFYNFPIFSWGRSKPHSQLKHNMNGVYFSDVSFKSGISVYLIDLLDRLYTGLQSNAYNPLYMCIASGKVRTSCLSRGERAGYWGICHAKFLVTLFLKITNF